MRRGKTPKPNQKTFKKNGARSLTKLYKGRREGITIGTKEKGKKAILRPANA